MSKMGKLSRLAICAAVGAAVLFHAPTVRADLTKCQGALEKKKLGYLNKVDKALAKCKNAIRKAQAGGSYLGGAAGSCEKAFFGVYGICGSASKPCPQAPGGALFKFTAGMENLNNGLGAGATCETADLDQLDHLVSTGAGQNAPAGTAGCTALGVPFACCTGAGTGTCPMSWVTTWLALAAEKLAWKDEVFAVGDARELLDTVIGLSPGAGAPASGLLGTQCKNGHCNGTISAGRACTVGAVPNQCAIDGACVAGPDPSHVYLPNLCSVAAGIWPHCVDHSCTLSVASGASLQPAAVAINGLAGGKTTFEVCKIPTGGNFTIDGSKFVALINEPSRTFQPPPTIAITPAITACIDTVRSEGWCDCTGNAVPFAPSFCLDHNSATVEPAPCADTPAASAESGCVCKTGGLLSIGGPCQAVATCTSCVSSGTGARCHPGTTPGKIVRAYAGASAANSCIDLNTIQFRLLPAALCLDINANTAVGECNAPSAPGAVAFCAGAGNPYSCCVAPGVGVCGLVPACNAQAATTAFCTAALTPFPCCTGAATGTCGACVSAVGADGVPCTGDDLVPPSTPTSVPFTTGSAVATINDFVNTEGSCAVNNVGMNCVRDADCGGAGTCTAPAPVFGCGTGPNANDCQQTAGPGLGVSCAKLESSNLANWKVVGAFPALDGAGGINDAVTEFTLACN